MRYSTKTLDFYTDRETVITLGKFDGLHRGHMVLIRRVLQEAKAGNLESVVFTFDVPPASHLTHTPPRQLLTNQERRTKLEQLGIAYAVECPFVDKLMCMDAEEFIRRILVEQLHAKLLVVGDDFHFGHKRAGDVRLLQSLEEKYGYETLVIPRERHEGRVISSTWIRDLLKEGNLDLAEELLGYSFYVTGPVLHGRALGRTIGIPTINQIPPNEKILPKFGVYVVKADFGDRAFYGIANIGVKPTVGATSFAGVESYLFDCQEDLYGLEPQVSLLKFVRPEKVFASLEALKDQLVSDERRAREFLALQGLYRACYKKEK